MATVSRTSQFAKVLKVLKKHYQPVPCEAERPVLEHLLYACCLEDAHYEAAEEAFAAAVHTFFDWNEIRVTSIAELSEVLSGLPEPRAASNRLKRVLQSVFEATYAFDLEEHRKKNLGPTVKWLQKLDGTTNFSVAYVVQSALGGHAIPIDSGVLAVLRIVDLVSAKDLKAGVVPGLERAVAKSKGIEFGSLLHQLGADYIANPYSPALRQILLQIDPDAEDRLPKRRAGKKTPQRPSQEPAESPSSTAADKNKSAAEKKKTSPRKKASASQENPPAAAKKKSSASEADPKKKKSTAEGLSKPKPR